MNKKLSFTAQRMLTVFSTILLIIVLSLCAFVKTLNIMEQRGWQILDGAANNLAAELSIRFEDNINHLKYTAATLQLSDSVPQNTILQDETLPDSRTLFSRIDVLYPDNTLALPSGDTLDVSSTLSFDELAARGEHMSVRTVDAVDHETAVVHYYIPVMRDGQTAAIVIGVIDCASLADLFLALPYDGGCMICIVDHTDGAFLLNEWDTTFDNLSGYHAGTADKGFSISKKSLERFEHLELWLVLDEKVAFSSLIAVKLILLMITVLEIAFSILYVITTIKNAKWQKKSQAEVERQLMTSNTLVNCIATLSNYSEIDGSINNLLEIITQYFSADRSYLYELNYEKQTVSNTYECVAKGTVKKSEMMQDIPLEKLQFWLDKLNSSGLVHITNLDAELDKSSVDYSLLAQQNIQSIMAVPLMEKDHIIGFLGVDNPLSNCHDYFLLSSITYFLMDNLDKRRKQTILERLSFEDTLTKLYNRNKYNEVIDEYTTNPPSTLGIAYFDLNGLKVMNDEFGHKAGDNLLKNTAQNIQLVFSGYSFRFGGDEFVVIVPNLDEQTFLQKVEQVFQLMEVKQISVSCGISWCGADNNIARQLHEADERMYENKKKHYETVGQDRRRR